VFTNTNGQFCGTISTQLVFLKNHGKIQTKTIILCNTAKFLDVRAIWHLVFVVLWFKVTMTDEPSVSGPAQGCSLEARPVLIFPSSPTFYVAVVCQLVIVGKVKGEGVTPKVS